MKEILIPTIGDPGTFVPLSSGDPTYYTEAASFDQRKLFYDLNQAGYNIIQVEDTDIDGIITWIQACHTSLSSFIDDFITYLEEGGTYPSEPSLPALPSGYEVFYDTILTTINRYYHTLDSCRRKLVEGSYNQKIADGIDDVVAQEGIVYFDNHRVWMKSTQIDNLP